MFSGEKYNADRFVLSGLSGNEVWASWTDRNEMEMLFRILDADSAMLKGAIELARVYNQKQAIKIYVNDEPVFEGDAAAGNLEISFSNPRRDILLIFV